jgi:hypothetical protein
MHKEPFCIEIIIRIGDSLKAIESLKHSCPAFVRHGHISDVIVHRKTPAACHGLTQTHHSSVLLIGLFVHLPFW